MPRRSRLATEIEHRWRLLEFEATDPQLRKWLSMGHKLAMDRGTEEKLDNWLRDRREKYNQDFRKSARAALWTALDAGGYIRSMSPVYEQIRNRYFGYRDYFTGLGYNSAVEHGPPERILSEPHRSIVYRRKSTKTWAVTFSVPVPQAEPELPPVGVLAMTVNLTTDEAPASSSAAARFTVLVDTKPDGNGKPGLVVRHPYMETLPPDLDDEYLPLFYADQLVQDAREKPPGWQELPQYTDPVDREGYGGLWVAAVQPVIVRSDDDRPVNSGFLVVVQEREEEVLEPVAALQWRLGISATIAGLFLVLVLAVVWAGTVSVLSTAPKSRMTRLLRRWAGLPTGTSASTGSVVSLSSAGTPASGSGVSDLIRGVKTARVGVAVTPGESGDLVLRNPQSDHGEQSPRSTPTDQG